MSLCRLYTLPKVAPAAVSEMPAGDFAQELWRPGINRVRPVGMPLFPSLVWWLFHWLRIFRNGGYAVFLLRKGDEIVFRATLFPGSFKFPFMKKADIQIGDVWTAESLRGRGIAAAALGRIRQLLRCDGEVYYITDDGNAASIKAVEKAGFVLAGHCRRECLPVVGRYLKQ